MAFVKKFLQQRVLGPDDIWKALYCLLLDYIYGAPRITDSNRLTRGVWRRRAQQVEEALAAAIGCPAEQVEDRLDVFMRQLYPKGKQRMNPIGIAFTCAVVYLIQHFSAGSYRWKIEAKIGTDVFPRLTGFRRKSVDIVAFRGSNPFAVISTKWGIRHDPVRDPQEEADAYKREAPRLRFYVVTNEFDGARLQKLLTYPTIDGVFHVRRDLAWQVHGRRADKLAELKDLIEVFPLFP